MAMIEVILLERIETLGQMGEVVKVRPGYARNFLLPHKKALRATKENRSYFETQRAQLEAQNLVRKQEAEAVAQKMDGLSVIVIRQAGETGQLYGSVSTRDVAEKVTEAGFTIDRRQVLQDQPIKALGLHKTRVALHPEVITIVTVNVAQSPEEAEVQAKAKTPTEAPAAAPQAEAEAEPAAPVEAEAEAAPVAAEPEEGRKSKGKGKAKKAE
jgi:large subunit ribosomal protein L9